MPTASPEQRDVFWINLNPTRGREQQGTRPCLIVSPNWLNQGPSGLIFVVPLTRTFRNIPTQVRIEPPTGGIEQTSYLVPEQLRSISVDRLGRYIGSVPKEILEEVKDHLYMFLDL